MVAEHGERVVGFMIYELHKTRPHILNFAVAPEFRRRGVGRQMVAPQARHEAFERLRRMVHHARGARDESPVQLFFKRLAFRATMVLRSFYEDSPEDAYLMQFRHAPADLPAIASENRIDRLAG